MVSDVRLIILNLTKYGENSIVIHTLSREYGRRSFMVKVGKKTSMALFLPLNIVEASVCENPKSNLWKAYGFSSVYPLNGIRSNLYKNSMTMFMSEVLYRVVKDGTNEDGLFDWCLSSIMTLDTLDSDFSNYHIHFLLELASALGFRPTAETLKPFAKDHLIPLSQMVTLPLAESMLLPLTGDQRNGMCLEVLRYLEACTESAIHVRSLEVLSELFH